MDDDESGDVKDVKVKKIDQHKAGVVRQNNTTKMIKVQLIVQLEQDNKRHSAEITCHMLRHFGQAPCFQKPVKKHAVLVNG